ncbi:MAG: hypothetical protein CVU48_02615 [Candidatus Cloacimonetes bacterium HGW-Cloacimonetes-1]|nr:MAG: hypothetical protein CVU48_02615 [Candidatus Cloacimonetes bacterium HGW-Cloacimonetes-1]
MKGKQYFDRLTSKEFYSTRNGKIFANLSSSIILKFINMLIGFVMVPITLNYLDKTRYGLWAALSSMLAWILIFDVGIGNGLRNKFTELKAKIRFDEIKEYVSTAYVLFGLIALVLTGIFFSLNRFIDWSKVLNAPDSMKGELSETVFIVFFVMSINFVVRLINTILTADLKNAISNGLSTIAQVITFIGIIVLSRFTTPSILKYALLYTGSNVSVTVIASIYLFRTTYKAIAPSLSKFKLSLWHDLVNVGVKFFVIQLSLIVFAQSTNLLISNLLGPESVTDYSISMKYFSLISMMFAMMVQPLWTGYGDAYYRGDYSWIRQTFGRLKMLWVVVMAVMILMVFVQKPIFDIWLHGKVQVNYLLSSLLVLYFSLFMIVSIYNPFINSTSKLKLQMMLCIPMAVFYVLFGVLLVKFAGMGSEAIVISLIVFQVLPLAILSPIQAHKILNGATGIWGK